MTAEKIFLAHAGVAPLPRRTVEAITDYLARAAVNDQEACFPVEHVVETRVLAAGLLGCAPEEIALLGPTSLGLSLVANGLDLPSGANVVCYRDDYPANVYPWWALAYRGRGIEVRSVRTARYGAVTPEAVAAAVDRRTRLVALASAHFLTGYRLDIAAIGRYLRERDILFCVDGIQTLGALRTTVEHVDFLAADSHKWLLGPNASGLLYVRRENWARLRPALLGAGNVVSPGYLAQDRLELVPDARRYEPGSLNYLGIAGLRASLQLLTEIGLEAIESRVLALAARLIDLLRAKGYGILGPTAGPGLTGIVSCRKPGVDLPAVHAQLEARGILTSLRTARDGAPLLRFSPHFYNTEAELEQAVAALP